MHYDLADTDSIADRAREMAGRISDPTLAARYARLVFQEMRADLRNLRPAEAEDLTGARPWALAKHKKRQLYVFAACRASISRLQRVSLNLEYTWLELQYLQAQAPALLTGRERDFIHDASEFIAKIGRVDFATMQTKARAFSRRRRDRLAALRATQRLCPNEEICAAPGRVWRRITTVADMWGVGAEFRNCMARRSGHSGVFAKRMRSGSAEFFVLRDQDGRGLMVALGQPNQMRLEDVKGPGNCAIDPDDPCVVALAAARYWAMSPRLPLMLTRWRQAQEALRAVMASRLNA